MSDYENLPKEWRLFNLEKIAAIIDPHPSHRAPEEVAEGVAFAGIGDLTENGELILGKVRIVPLSVLDEHEARYELSGNSIGFGRVASIGKVIKFPSDVCGLTISPTMAIIEPHSINRDFLLHFLRGEHVGKVIDKWLTGSTRSSLGIELLRKLPVPVPDPELQKHIGTILSSVESAIEKTKALIVKYQKIKAGLMHDVFTRGITPDGKLRPPRERAPELYKETLIGWIPKDWETTGLRAKVIPGIAHLRTGPFGSSLKGEHWVGEGHPVVTIGALGEGTFIESELLYVSDFDAKRLSEFQLKLGDVVFSRVADVGRSVVVLGEHVGWIMSSNLMRISLDRKQITPDLLQLQLSFDHRLKRQIRAKVNSSGREVANSEILNQLLFVWPAYDEQQRIVGQSTAIDRRLQAEESLWKKLIKQKYGVMHDLFTGKVSVKTDRELMEEACA